MKNTIYTAFILTALILIVPLLALSNVDNQTKSDKVPTVVYAKKSVKADNFRVLIKETQKIEKMSAEDYICGVVAAEMPALYEIEALKAQAVAAYSFACRKRAENKNNEYDISTDPKTDQAFIHIEEAAEKWGEKGGEYADKIRSAVKAVSGQTVNYNGEIALSVYHAISSGKTESAKDVWGSDIAYLTSVDSVWDKLSPNYLSCPSFNAEELKALLGQDINLDGSADDIEIIKKSDLGTVNKLKVGGKEFSGEKLREKLSLRSLCFTVSFEGGKYNFQVKGYGHGVGLSQYGADYMAKQGADYKEILKHYYNGATVG